VPTLANLSAIRVGAEAVDKVYLGVEQLWPISTNASPTPRMSPSQEIEVGVPFHLLALTTTDPETPIAELEFTWEITEQPAGSVVVLDDGDVPAAAGTFQDAYITATHAGEYFVRVGVEDGTNPIVWHDGSVFNAVGTTPTPGYLPQGDVDTPGVNPALLNGDEDILYVFDGSRVGASSFNNAGATAPGGFRELPARVITDQSTGSHEGVPTIRASDSGGGRVYIWTPNPGGRVKAGYEWRCWFGDLGLDTEMTKIAWSYVGYWPSGWQALGDMKVSDCGGCDPQNGPSTLNSLSQQGFVTYDGFNPGMMTGKWSADSSKHILKAYLNAYRIGGVSRRYPAVHLAASLNTTPTGSSRLLLNRNTEYEICGECQLNTPGQANGYVEFYVQPAGSARVLRYRRTDVEWRRTSASFINYLKFRNFWGGPVETEAPSSATTHLTAPRFSDFVIATDVDAIPLPRPTQ